MPPCLAFYVGAGNPNLDLHACTGSTVPTPAAPDCTFRVELIELEIKLHIRYERMDSKGKQ